MTAQLRQLMRLDLERIDLRKGVLGLGAILAFGVFVAIFGNIGMVAALATLFAIVADQPGPLRARGLGALIMTGIGSIIALVGTWAGPEHVVVAALLTFVVVLLATLVAGLGQALAVRGMLLSVWAVVAISFADGPETAMQMAIAYLGGGLIAAAIIYLRTRALPEPSLAEEAEDATRTFEQVLSSSFGAFALLRALAAGLAMWAGATLFPEHAIWAALTVILVMKPRVGETVASGVLRAGGTVIGVLAAEALILASGGETAFVLIGFLLAAIGMAALQKVNYAVFVACLTALLVLSEQLATGTGEATAADRLWATLLGAAIVFIAIAIGRAMHGKPVMSTEPDPPENGADPTPG